MAAIRASGIQQSQEQLNGAEGMMTDARLKWLVLRDCVEVGRGHRYSEAQLVYHYTQDKAVLAQAVDESWEGSVHSYDSAQDDRPWH